MSINTVPKIKHTDKNNFFLIAGPCVVESEEICFEIAEKVKAVTDKLGIPYIFKASYRKANRSRVDSFTGIGDEKALATIQKIGKHFDIPTITDIHSPEEAELAAGYVDILQIPAFLCRQTDLLIAAAQTGKHVNIKKGQFLSAESMKFTVDKIRDSNNNNIMLTERGTFFGYQDLVIDYRSIPEMQKNKVPVIMDITHSLQKPNQMGGVTGGRPDLIGTVAKAAVAVGVDGIFLETHPAPHLAKSDGATMLHLDFLETIMTDLVKIRKAIA
jgi:2-dehydro-3-deoxyphosphooctonate aldolase (KDO 8-P synthase)